jgi:hypothetical protein
MLQYLHIINAHPSRPLLPATPCLLTWRTSPLARGGEFLSTLVPGLLTTAPPLASPFTFSHPTHRSSYNVYIEDINNTSRPRLAQRGPMFNSQDLASSRQNTVNLKYAF